MKGIFLFSQLNDVLFMSLDDEISLFINEQARKASLIGDDDVYSSVDVDVIVQVFSPLVASQRFMMSEVGNPYNSIRCENDMIYVFSQIGDHTALTIGSVAEEKEEYFQRKLLVFRHLLMLFHGPVLKQLCTVSPPSDEKWKLIGQLLNQWEYLYHKEQSFLVEALEHLSVSEELNAQCVKLLESVIALMKSAGDRHIIHALLFVQTKLLALYSSRSAFELNSGDILLMILIASNSYPWQHQDVMRTAYGTSKRSHARKINQNNKSKFSHAASEEETKTACNKLSHTPKSPLTSGSDDTSQLTSSLLNIDESSYQEWTFLDDFQSEALWDANSLRLHQAKLSSAASHNGGNRKSDASLHSRDDWGDRNHGGGDRYQQKHCPDGNEMVKDISGKTEHSSFAVFLRTKNSQHTPVILHVVKVLPGIILVLVSELTKGNQAQMLVDAITSITMATECHCQPPHSVIASVDKVFKKLDLIQKQNKNLTQLRHLYQMIQTKWSVAKDLAQKVNKDQNELGSKNRLENTLDGIRACLENMFSILFLQTNCGSEQTGKALHQTVDVIQKKCQDILKDYKNYLITKALHNITVSSYIDSFPGLIHFIYTDRRTAYMKAPSLEVVQSSECTKKHIDCTIQHKIWDIVQWIQSKLSLGYTALLSHDQQLHFAYFLWYEDAMGNPLVAEQHPRSENGAVLPGILSSDFYSKLTHDSFPSTANKMSVHCYELLCVHVGLVPTQYVLSHCRKLAAMLWESSDVSTAFSIL